MTMDADKLAEALSSEELFDYALKALHGYVRSTPETQDWVRETLALAMCPTTTEADRAKLTQNIVRLLFPNEMGLTLEEGQIP
jgi:hypothetical protein